MIAVLILIPCLFKKLSSIKIITLHMFVYHLILSSEAISETFKYCVLFSRLPLNHINRLLLNNAPFTAQVFLPSPPPATHIKEPA